ncbi:uncharacterized protein LOC118182260 isoform X2 [Stegodyphus dumicola]|uniref:uncharacterized protein LOC118182260 isoform X2 n=1 Tax=Stegodyphus dumicola TaxID=202533 RepID=UPI0015A7F35C|nr:uncharacterized protein LOC118182260 isoform X2 [Stegodyphus dumicola]
MKTFLKEEDILPSVRTTCTGSRQPLKLLQDFQNCHSFTMSLKCGASTVRRSNSPRQKTGLYSREPSHDFRTRTPNVSSGQSTNARTSANIKTVTKSGTSVHKKQEMHPDAKIKVSDSTSSTSSSVGSLTSSPKWSHIKNKFENFDTIENTKSNKSVSLSKEDRNKLKSSTSKNLTSVHNINLGESKTKHSIFKIDNERKVASMSSTKSDTASVSSLLKMNNDKSKLYTSNLKNFQKEKAKSKTSPKSSQVNLPSVNETSVQLTSSPNVVDSDSLSKSTKTSRLSIQPNSSALHSTNSIWYSHFKPPTSSVLAVKSNSHKSSHVSIPSASSSNSSGSPKSSLLNIPVVNDPVSSNMLKNSYVNMPLTNTSALHTSVISKKYITSTKLNAKAKQKFEDKPILNVNSNKILCDKDEEKSTKRKGVSKTFTQIDQPPMNNATNKTSKLSAQTAKPNGVNTGSIIQRSENAEQIKELVKRSQPSSKTVWVKDSCGNWTKKSNPESKPISNSKVASLRNKFLESNKGGGQPLTKSVTTSDVPNKTVEQTNRPLAKSSTTSSICDKTCFDGFGSKVSAVNNEQLNKNNFSNCAEGCELLFENSACTNEEIKDECSKPGENIPKLSIVQRAVLSFEGSLALLSPETQKRLKLVSEKVRAQTDDDKLLQAKAKNEGKYQSSIEKRLNSQTASKHSLTGETVLNKNNLKNKSNDLNIESKVKNTEDIKSKGGLVKKLNTSSTKPSKDSSDCVADKLGRSNNVAPSLSQRTNMTLNLTMEHLNMKSSNHVNDYSLQPNNSFLWRRSEAASELSKSSTNSSVSLTSSDYRNYYDVENYYSSLELEIEKDGEEHIYIDSQGSSSSGNYGSSTRSYENVHPTVDVKNRKTDSYDEWADISDDDYMKSSLSTSQSSTLKKRKNKRVSTHKVNYSNTSKSADSRKPMLNDTISFTDSSDTLINDEVANESTFDLADANHFYEPVYESLGNYLLEKNEHDDAEKGEQDDENCSISLSPDDGDNADFMHCSLTSLESAESSKLEKEQICDLALASDNSNAVKKPGNKISQLKRHLSWTKNDIRLELSSKFNKIKIKKNGQNSTEIGVKVQEHESINTSPKKKTFIKCILRQKSSSSIPLKRSPSPKKESAHFYVHLSMGREKQRPFSDSVVADESLKSSRNGLQQLRKQSEPSLPLTTNDIKCSQQRPRVRKISNAPAIQRPKTPPPLPPMQIINTKIVSSSYTKVSEKEQNSISCNSTYGCSDNTDSPLYTALDPDLVDSANSKVSADYENDVFKNIRTSNDPSLEDLLYADEQSSASNTGATSLTTYDCFNLPFLPAFQSELLKSPFEEEPMYQFYHKDVQQRATLWYSADGSESEYEDDNLSKLSDSDMHNHSKPPVLQSQMSAMDLVHGEGGQRTLWCEVPEKIYFFTVFYAAYEETFSMRIKGLLADLEKRWLENIVLSNVCDIVYEHASKYFSVYVKYCSNQLYQERTLKELKEKRPDFVTVLKRLESNPVCQGLDMHSFLMLPMQRITRLPLLIDAIFHRLTVDSPIYESCKMALAMVNKLVAECNEGARKMERMEEMLVISQQLDFKDCKGFGLLSASRWLVKKGELVQLLLDNTNRRTFGRSSRWCKIQLYLFLFTDLLVVTRKKGDDSYFVVDYCPRNMLQVKAVDENTPPLPVRLPSSYRNLFQMTMLNNRDGKTVEMLLSCLLESDRTRWMDAVTPAKSENPDEKIYEEWDCPQVQCTHAYNAQQPDELSLEEADVVNVFRKMADGWFEGERIRDGVRGWFPSSHAVEIINSHVRARNLHQRYRLLMLSQTYLEEQYKAQAILSKK